MSIYNKIGLGSVQFGMSYGVSNYSGQTSSKEVTKILNHASELGITVIDTAIVYGNAEKVLGSNDLNKFKIISKFMPSKGNDTIETQLTKSLSDLNIESLYGYLAHRPISLVDNPNDWEELLILKQKKRIYKIGFSLNEPYELALLIQKGMIPDLIQVPYSYFDNRFKEILKDLKSKGCEIHTRSTFLQGLFFSDVKKLSSFFDDVKQSISNLQTNFTNNLSSVLLKYVLSLDFIDVVIMGVVNKEQLINNLHDINMAPILDSLNTKFPDSIIMPSNWPKIK
jgi:aryl-alcohol dehydrogenase-like predicted oxidoreductase